MRFSTILAFAPLALGAPAPFFNVTHAGQIVPDKYIVKFKDEVSLSARDETLSILTTDADHVYSDVFNGFAATLDADTLGLLRDHPNVEYIEQDAVFTIDYLDRTASLQERQVPNPWNLIRISHRQNTGTSYLYNPSGGTGTCIYILDTGIAATHPNFAGKATNIANFVGGGNTDAVGHGTAMAGIAMANEWGVSRQSRALGVKVYNDQGSSTTSVIIASFQFVVQDVATRNCANGAFINFSGGGPYSAALNNAATNIVDSGHFIAADAGANGGSVNNVSPASAQAVCSVGSSDRQDRIPAFSNTGPIDLYAPGVGVTSLGLTGTTLVSYAAGTPHVTGVAAYLSTLQNLPANQLCDYLIFLATPNVLQGAPGARLLYNGGD